MSLKALKIMCETKKKLSVPSAVALTELGCLLYTDTRSFYGTKWTDICIWQGFAVKQMTWKMSVLLRIAAFFQSTESSLEMKAIKKNLFWLNICDTCVLFQSFSVHSGNTSSTCEAALQCVCIHDLQMASPTKKFGSGQPQKYPV